MRNYKTQKEDKNMVGRWSDYFSTMSLVQMWWFDFKWLFRTRNFYNKNATVFRYRFMNIIKLFKDGAEIIKRIIK